MVNEDRKNFGLALHRSIRENMALPTLPLKQKAPLLNKKQEEKDCLDMGKMLTLKAASIEHEAFSLSGGNQQKVVLAKWLLCEFAAKGMAVIMISSELPEVMGMSDRILIYHEGKINGEVKREEILSGDENQESILRRAFGGK